MSWKKFMFAVLVFASKNSQAQVGILTTYFEVGANYSQATETSNFVWGTENALVGYKIGAAARLNTEKNLFFETGLYLSKKGMKRESAELWLGSSNAPITYANANLSITYLQLPLKVGYYFSLGQNTRLTIDAGPYLGYGIHAKRKTDFHTVGADMPDETKIQHPFKSDELAGLKRLDFGASAGIGVEYKRFNLSVDYELGIIELGNPNPSPFDSTPYIYKYKNRAGVLTLGYLFGK